MTSILKVTEIQDPTNSNSALSIDSSGRILFPQLPCACVSLTTANSQDGSNPYTTTGADILFDVVTINQGSVYNASNGRFTAPIAGIYEFSYNYLKDDANTVTYLNVFKNGSQYTGAGGRAYSENPNTYAMTSMTLLISLAANDFLTLQLGSGGIHIDGSAYAFYHSIVFKLVG
tara:strand:+ start:919 stop:1440 length:522 start_codon:yes stop_codon:yes gene_type:complete